METKAILKKGTEQQGKPTMPPHIRDEMPSASWLNPTELDADRFTHRAGKILLGRARDKLIGIEDNRHIVTIAGSRAGKSATSLMSNLLTWDGSVIAIDPKGELATNSAAHRAAMGQDVYILDPFGEVKGKAAKYRANFNPLLEILQGDELDRVDDAAMLADAMILSDGRNNDHWTQSGKNLVQSLLLFLLVAEGVGRDLIQLRNLLSAPQSNDDAKIDSDTLTLETLFGVMAQNENFDGVIANAGSSFQGKPKSEAASIISTANEQLSFLRSSRLADHVMTSDFSLRDLKRKPTTIYLVLPASRMASHFRWLRIILMQAMSAMERTENATGRDVLFILEEFPTLGYMRQLEAAAGLMAGYQVKLWTVMQDLSQIKALYPNSWETFIGNAGIIEAFGNTDATTTEYLSKRLGTTLAIQQQPENQSLQAQAAGAPNQRETIVTVPLMAPYEITQAFNRDNQNKLIIWADGKPFALKRVFWKDLKNGG